MNRKTTLAMAAIVAAIGLVGVLAIETLILPLQQQQKLEDARVHFHIAVGVLLDSMQVKGVASVISWWYIQKI
jgi:hypothetical protein